jgi:hypothetical protein
MTNFFIIITVGGLLALIINYKKQKPGVKKSITATSVKKGHLNDEASERTILSRISTLETRVDRNESNIESLENKDEQKNLQIDQMYHWFGSMIRHSAEEPFKKAAIEKFLAEEELKNTTNE